MLAANRIQKRRRIYNHHKEMDYYYIFRQLPQSLRQKVRCYRI